MDQDRSGSRWTARTQTQAPWFGAEARAMSEMSFPTGAAVLYAFHGTLVALPEDE